MDSDLTRPHSSEQRSEAKDKPEGNDQDLIHETATVIVPLLLILLYVLSYGLWIPFLGLHWANWAKLWIATSGVFGEPTF